MSRSSVRKKMFLLPAFTAIAIGGCCHGPQRDDLSSAQIHARDLYAENQRLLAENQQNSQMLMGLGQENQALMAQLGDAQNQVATANDRLNNLMAERNAMNNQFAQAMGDGMSDGSGVNSALQAEGFEYDPVTGLNKFRSDILFDLGSDRIRPEALTTIKEFASSVTSGKAAGMKILVVGHTDDQNIARPETAAKHPTNWHLSTDRSDAVILELEKLGVSSQRVASMGYSEFHPLESSTTETARQRNRRVELFVVPNDPSVAKWDPVNALR